MPLSTIAMQHCANDFFIDSSYSQGDKYTGLVQANKHWRVSYSLQSCRDKIISIVQPLPVSGGLELIYWRLEIIIIIKDYKNLISLLLPTGSGGKKS